MKKVLTIVIIVMGLGFCIITFLLVFGKRNIVLSPVSEISSDLNSAPREKFRKKPDNPILGETENADENVTGQRADAGK